MTMPLMPANATTAPHGNDAKQTLTSRRTRSGATPSALDELHDWHFLGAQEKARSVQMLTKGLDVRTVLEIGSGTGAILERLDDAGFADQYFAVEPSKELCAYMVERDAISRLVAADNTTIGESNLAKEHYDLCVISHVLEHVEDPAILLAQALKIADHVIVEVPLGGTWLGNVRAYIRSAITRVPRHNNPAGHVQFFSREDIHSLATWCGGRVVRSRAYVPFAQMRRAMHTGPRRRRAYARFVWLITHVVGERLWARNYYGHFAVLVRPGNAIPAGEKTHWNAAYFDEGRETGPAVAAAGEQVPERLLHA